MLGTVAHAYNHSTQEDQKFKASLSYTRRLCLKNKYIHVYLKNRIHFSDGLKSC
jgi:hypothetical protein